MMRIFFSVGEPSGDVHGANLVRELQQQNPDVECVGFGGPKMRDAGCQLLLDLTQFAVMFFWTAIKNYPKFKGFVRDAEKYFDSHHIDAVVLIDYPGFNWHIAKAAKKRGIPVFYYGVPQMWAWAPWRVHKLKRRVDHVLCKLPFEPEWFSRRGVTAHFVGHPFFDEAVNRKPNREFMESFANPISGDQSTLLLLPGSRDSEIERNWPTIRDAAAKAQKEFPQLRVVVGCFKKSQHQLIRHDIVDRGLSFETFLNKTPELMRLATACIACGGSVSLRLLHNLLPTIIVYRISRLQFFLQRFFIRVKYITLVNLITQRNPFPEHVHAL
ncbi:MAG: lipid-A-disaccharide synthase [Pirellulaceae bacterium]